MRSVRLLVRLPVFCNDVGSDSMKSWMPQRLENKSSTAVVVEFRASYSPRDIAGSTPLSLEPSTNSNQRVTPAMHPTPLIKKATVKDVRFRRGCFGALRYRY